MTVQEIIAELKKCNVVPRLSGDQLKLVGETGRLSADLLQQIKTAKEELCTYLNDVTGQLSYIEISSVEIQDDYPVSNAQKRIWVLSQLQGGTAAYIIVRSFYLRGYINKERLNKAFRSTIQRHESLRTVFKEVEGFPRQVILNDIVFEVEEEDVSDNNNKIISLQKHIEEFASRPFDLESGPLIRVKLFSLSAHEHAMVLAIHHIISDGWSLRILMQ